jgi:hypothetical protein
MAGCPCADDTPVSRKPSGSRPSGRSSPPAPGAQRGAYFAEHCRELGVHPPTGHVQHQPTRAHEQVEPPAIAVQLISVGVPLAVVFHRHPIFRPRQVRVKNHAVGQAHRMLDDRSWQATQDQPHPQLRFWRGLGPTIGHVEEPTRPATPGAIRVLGGLLDQCGAVGQPLPEQRVNDGDRADRIEPDRRLPGGPCRVRAGERSAREGSRCLCESGRTPVARPDPRRTSWFCRCGARPGTSWSCRHGALPGTSWSCRHGARPGTSWSCRCGARPGKRRVRWVARAGGVCCS